ncbi:MAG: hypothetical protein KatS3mg009_2298 [Acidimicrobiia bacterium]|nr:MAG: hypothetical protein KatS3mg009_2298 [Acidimicrobiia bacterium]
MTEPNPDRAREALERAIEILVFAPLGAGLFVRDSAPSLLATFVARGRAEVDRTHEAVSRRVTTARSLGQVAVAFGVPMARERLRRHLDEARARAGGLVGSPRTPPGAPHTPGTPGPPGPAATAEPPPPPAGPAAAPSGANGAAHDAPSSADLPIPGYDALSASQVVERLAGLAPGELDAVRAYELAHRNRRTILGKIEQLAG